MVRRNGSMGNSEKERPPLPWIVWVAVGLAVAGVVSGASLWVSRRGRSSRVGFSPSDLPVPDGIVLRRENSSIRSLASLRSMKSAEEDE